MDLQEFPSIPKLRVGEGQVSASWGPSSGTCLQRGPLKYDALGLALPDLCANSSTKTSPPVEAGWGHSDTPRSVQRGKVGGKAG